MKNKMGFTLAEMAIVLTVGTFMFFTVLSTMFNGVRRSADTREKLYDDIELKKAIKHLKYNIRRSAFMSISDSIGGPSQDSGPVLALYDYQGDPMGEYSSVTRDQFRFSFFGKDTFFPNVAVNFAKKDRDTGILDSVKIEVIEPASIALSLLVGSRVDYNNAHSAVELEGVNIADTVIPAYGGGYLVLGLASLPGCSHTPTLIKLDDGLNLEWAKGYVFGGRVKEGQGLVTVLDSRGGTPVGYLIYGEVSTSGPDPNNMDVMCIRVDLDGNVLWKKKYGGVEYENGKDCKQLFDETGSPDGFIVIGSTSSFGPPSETMDVYVVKIKNNGDPSWAKKYASGENDDPVFYFREFGKAIEPIYDEVGELDGFILMGTEYADARDGASPGDHNYWMINISANGKNIGWSHTFGNNLNEQDYDYLYHGRRIVTDPLSGEEGYIMAGISGSYSEPGANMGMYFVVTDEQGVFDFAKVYSFVDGERISNTKYIQQTADYGFICSGKVYLGGTEQLYFLMKTDLDGNVEWTNAFPGVFIDKVNEVVDEGYLLAGKVADGSALVIKTNEDGECPEAENPTVISVDPVPVFGTILFSNPDPECESIVAEPDTHYLAQPE